MSWFPALLTALALLVSVPLKSAQGTFTEAAVDEQSILHGQIKIPAGRQWMVRVSVQAHYRRARIAGSVQASGGSGNDIRILVLKGNNLIFDSGRRRSIVMSVDCHEPGEYSLIIDNTFSVLSSKIVAGHLRFVHAGISVRETEEYQRLNRNFQDRAIRIMTRLYSAVRADDYFWGTSQLTTMPIIRLNPDESINAAASPRDNTIMLNRGLFKFADQTGHSDDVLAAVLAHELGHIFYQHSGYGGGQGVKGFFDELLGVTGLDRVQEMEADFLGVRTCCLAGFDPAGVILVMDRFARDQPRANSFMKSHPAAIERRRYLLDEVERCPAWRTQSVYPQASRDEDVRPRLRRAVP